MTSSHKALGGVYQGRGRFATVAEAIQNSILERDVTNCLC